MLIDLSFAKRLPPCAKGFNKAHIIEQSHTSLPQTIASAFQAKRDVVEDQLALLWLLETAQRHHRRIELDSSLNPTHS